MNNIKNARCAVGMTQQQAADALNVTRVTYARYESGERQPTFATLMAMSKMYGRTIDYLVGNTQDVIDHHDTQALTEEEQELLRLWRSADQTSHMYAISVLKTKNSIYQERGIS